jgi:hypothetical protein
MLAAVRPAWLPRCRGGLSTDKLQSSFRGDIRMTMVWLHEEKLIERLRCDGTNEHRWYLTQKGLDELKNFEKKEEA